MTPCSSIDVAGARIKKPSQGPLENPTAAVPYIVFMCSCATTSLLRVRFSSVTQHSLLFIHDDDFHALFFFRLEVI
jgi:hypothetical protein